MMVNLMRSNQRWLMIVVSVLVLISFLWYFSNSSRIERLGGDRAGTIYGHTITVSDLQRADRQLNTAGELGLGASRTSTRPNCCRGSRRGTAPRTTRSSTNT